MPLFNHPILKERVVFYLLKSMANANPFLDLINNRQGQPTQGAGVNAGGVLRLLENGASQQPQLTPGQEPPEVTQAGVTGDQTKPLIMALNALHQFIASSGDRADIGIARSIMNVLTGLIRRNQASATQAGPEQTGQETT